MNYLLPKGAQEAFPRRLGEPYEGRLTVMQEHGALCVLRTHGVFLLNRR